MTMLKRLTNLLLNHSDDEIARSKQSDVVINDLQDAISSINDQLKKISRQENVLQERLNQFKNVCADKQTQARIAHSQKNRVKAESLYQESLLVEQQIEQYRRLLAELLETRRKLTSQRNQFGLAKDKITAKIAMGEANVDASQKHAELAEQLMLLEESGEFSQYEETILEAECRTQAITEIQQIDAPMAINLNAIASSPGEQFEAYLREEKEKKLQENLASKQKILDQVFGRTAHIPDEEQIRNKQELLQQLKEAQGNHKNKMESFFNQPISAQREKEDRIKDFFKS